MTLGLFGACTTKKVQVSPRLFRLAGSAEPNIGEWDNWYHEAGYELDLLTLHFLTSGASTLT